MWSYIATIINVGAGVLLFPFIVHKMSAETVGIWNIFQTITLFVILFDFGFRPTFARSISYIFSGVKRLDKEGVTKVDVEADAAISYTLLKDTLQAMRKFYRWLALGMLVVLSTAGMVYFNSILNKYKGDHQDAMIAWVMLIAINCYNLYTLYYEALLLGKGYVKRSQQIAIIGQSVYILVAIVLIWCGFGLTAIVSAQLLSVVIRRILSRKVFFTKELKAELQQVESHDANAILRTLFPNAAKMGLTSLGGLLITRSAILLGSTYLPLTTIASYGISLQVTDILARCALVFFQSYTPRLAQYRAEKNKPALWKIYKQSVLLYVGIFAVGGVAFVLLGDWALEIIKSDTDFLSRCPLIVLLVVQFLENNHVLAAGFLAADNRIPFFIPSLLSGLATIVLMWIFLSQTNLGIWGLILAPGIAQLAYQNWKWPTMVIRELQTA